MSKRKNKPADPAASDLPDVSAALNPDQQPDKPDNIEPLDGKDMAYSPRQQMLKEIAQSAAKREGHDNSLIVGVDPATGQEAIIRNPDVPEPDATTDDEETDTDQETDTVSESAQGAGAADQPPVPSGATPPADGSQPTGTAPTPDVYDPAKFRKLKINGEEKIVPIDQVIEAGVAAFQKQAAADQNLQLASHILDQAKRAAGINGGQQPQPAAQPQPQPLAPQMAAKLAEVSKRIQFGTPEESQQALDEFRQMIAHQTTTQVVGQMRDQVRVMMAHNSAVEKFGQDFPDIVSNEDLLNMAFNREDRLRASGDTRPFGVLYAEIGKSLREQFVPREKWPATAQPQPSPAPVQGGAQPGGMNPSQARQERKDAAVGAVTGQAAPPPSGTPKRPPTVSETIAKMARARGQEAD